LGEVVYQPDGRCGPRFQHDYQVVYLHSGELSAVVDGLKRHLVPGQVGLFTPGKTERFYFSAIRETHHSWCSVAPRMVVPQLAGALARAPEVLPYDQVQARLLGAAMALGRADSELSQGLVDQLGLALLGAYVHAAAEHAAGGVVARAVRYMEQHLAEAGCLQNVHEAVGVSRNTLINRFRAELGVTPSRHLWRLRAERGIAMLSETGHTLAEIAEACGFGDQFHFSRLVKSLQGLSPRDLRRKLWSAEPR
jgi:AraC-like DNA-binding protein